MTLDGILVCCAQGVEEKKMDARRAFDYRDEDAPKVNRAVSFSKRSAILAACIGISVYLLYAAVSVIGEGLSTTVDWIARNVRFNPPLE